MDKETIKELDDVLSFLNTKTNWDGLRDKFPEAQIPRERIKNIIRQLELDGYVLRFSGTTLIQGEYGYKPETRIIRTVAGDTMVSNGGYKKAEKKKIVGDRLKFAKGIFEIIIACLTVLLTFLSFRQANKIKSLEDNNEILKKTVDSINTSATSIEFKRIKTTLDSLENVKAKIDTVYIKQLQH